jgi:plasmid stabilization system protein ParE
MNLTFHPEAREEYLAAAHYYADCQEGLESRFVAAIESALQRIDEAPERWRVFEEDVRRNLVHVFPYAILYSIESDDSILIIAVMHCSREPGYWRARIRRPD